MQAHALSGHRFTSVFLSCAFTVDGEIPSLDIVVLVLTTTDDFTGGI